jgi:hypothetical protein
MEQIPYSEANIRSAIQEIPTVYGPEGSLPCSQWPTTGPYTEPDESNPHIPTLFL